MSSRKFPRRSLPATHGVIIVLLLTTLFVYLPPYADAFVGDDYVQLRYVRDFVERPFTAYQVFHPLWVKWYYRPLQNLWFLANRLVFGLNPFGFYYLQICLHLAAVALVYRVGRQSGLGAVAAVASAALFAIRGHHPDVVAWISSIAIVLAAVFSLLALSSYLSYLRKPVFQLLLLTGLFFVLALLSHEEGFLLLPVLLFWRIGIRDWRLQLNLQSLISNLRVRQEIVLFLFMFLAVGVYVPVQLWRDNAIIDVTDMPAMAYLAPARIGRFVVETLVRILPVSSIEANVVILSLVVLILLGVWFWRGGRVARFGLAWMALHLAFIYWVLWTQRPEFFAGRHIYIGWVGFSLAVGGSVGDWGVLVSRLRLKVVLVGVVVVAMVLIEARHIGQFQTDWLAMTREEAEAARQMKEIVPVAEGKHLFAYRFAIRPEYLPSFAEVWYGIKLQEPSGSLNQLQQYGQATDDFYVLDYESGRVYNLMPELQEHDKTVFLWSERPRLEIVSQDEAAIVTDLSIDVTVAGPMEARRLALPVQPPESEGEWLALVYVTTVPEQSQFRFGLSGSGRLSFRVRLIPATGRVEVLYEVTLESSAQRWTEVAIPMASFGGQPVVLRLETAGEPDELGYWANPRFVIGD